MNLPYQSESDQNDQFRLLAEKVEEYAIFLLDTEGHVKSWNKGAEKIKGYDEEEIIGEHFSVFYPKQEAEAGRPEEGLRIARREGDWTDEGWRVRKDECRFWARVTITALSDEDGELKGFAKVTRDLTDQHRREEDLARQRHEAIEAKEEAQQSKARLSAFLEQLPMGAGMLDTEGRWVMKNPALERLMRDRIPSQDPEERPHWQTWAEDGSPVDPSEWPGMRALRGETVYPGMDFLYTSKDGAERWLRVTAAPFYNSEGAIAGATAVLEDVTERRRLQRKLLYVQKAERRRLGQELHDGVSSILAGASMMASFLTAKARKGEDIGFVRLEKITDYIQQAAEKTRAVSHGLTPLGEKRVLEDALEALGSRVEVRGDLECSVETSGPAPELSDQVALHLYRIAQEAATNTIKHAEAEHIRISLLTEDEGTLVLTVQDDGKGLSGSEDCLSESSSSKVSSFSEGIGVRTMRHRADLIGATLAIEEASGGGTAVRCRLLLEKLAEEGVRRAA